MKKSVLVLGVLLASQVSFAKLTAVNCESNVALTLTEDRSEGTVSLHDGDAIGVFTMKKVGGNADATLYRVALPMMSMTVHVANGEQEDGYREYNVTTKTEFDGSTKEAKHDCTSVSF